MDMHILEQSKHKAVIDFKSEDRTIVDLIRKEMWSDEDVKAVGVNQPHPLVSTPRLVIEVKGSPKSALNGAVSRSKKTMTKLEKEFSDAF